MKDYIIITIIVLLFWVLVFFIRFLIRIHLIKSFYQKYEIKLSRTFKIKNKKIEETNYFILRYPHWLYANKNGTRNKVRKDNSVVCANSEFHIENYLVYANNPAAIIKLVNMFRDMHRDIKIELSEEEKIKKEEVEKKHKLIKSNKKIYEIINSFYDNPTDFEKFVGNYYSNKGFEVIVTPKTNDGGYDLKIKNKKYTAIVECKCYNPKNKIGRPAIQKLVGANLTENANEMIFITTSDFSKEAIDYANEAGVELINGIQLEKMINNFRSDSEDINEKEYRISYDDIYHHIPSDISINIDEKL